MPRPAPKDEGFTLIEVLAVLFILALMAGVIALNIRQPPPPLQAQTQAMLTTTNRYLQDGVIAGDMRAMGVSKDGYALYRFDGDDWQAELQQDWAAAYKIKLVLDGDDKAELPKVTAPVITFEPTGLSTDFVLTLSDGAQTFRFTPRADGAIILASVP